MRACRQMAFLLMLGFAASAQYVEYRSVEGSVTFRDGEPVRGAVVQLRDTHTLSIRSYITKRDGRYHFESLNPDIDYELRVSYHNKFGKAKTLSQFNARKHAKIDLKVEP